MSDEHARLEEHVLRRALRLDTDEVPPRLDPILIAAASRAARPARGVLLTVAAVAFLGGWVWSEAVRALVGAVLSGVDPLDTVIRIATGVLVAAAPAVDIATHPAIPIAIFAAAAVAAFSERRRSHVPAS